MNGGARFIKDNFVDRNGNVGPQEFIAFEMNDAGESFYDYVTRKNRSEANYQVFFSMLMTKLVVLFDRLERDWFFMHMDINFNNILIWNSPRSIPRDGRCFQILTFVCAISNARASEPAPPSHSTTS